MVMPERNESRPPFEERLTRVSTVAEFGALLTELRERSRLTVREVARKSGLAVATGGGYFAGTHVPALKLIDAEFTQMLYVLGVREEQDVAAWHDVARRLRRAGRRAGDRRSPYRGLAAFEPEDSEWFFGRTELIDVVHTRAVERRRQQLPLLVVGPSGSGKSSLLRAGLIPLLRREGSAALITPGRDPLGALTVAVPDDADVPPDWIVVDQFEELFTHESTAEERARFIEELLRTCEYTGVIIGMRADFYAAALSEPGLAAAFQDGQVVVGPMDRAQIREVIVGPARLAGVSIADGLVELLIEQSFQLGARQHAGTLPLLSHALLATWTQHEGDILTSQDYLATGGIADAIARSAEDAYAELDPADQDLVRGIFLHQLVHVAEGMADTARKVDLDQLPGMSGDEGGAELPAPIAAFIDRRLLTIDAGTLQIAHEALIGSWPRLRSWLDADRALLISQRRLSFAADNWRDTGRDSAALLRGAPLTVAELRVQEAGDRWQPTALVREFLAQSIAQRRTEEQARQRASRRLRMLAGALAVLLVVATGIAFYASVQRGDAQSATRTADARAVAEAADAVRGLDPNAAAQLSLASYRISSTVQSRSALLESTATPQASRAVDAASLVEGIAVNPAHTVAAAAAADGTLRLWNVAHPGDPTEIGGPLLNLPDRQLFADAISPNGDLLAASGSEDTISVWNIADPSTPHPLPTLTGPANTVYVLAFNPAGTLLAAGSADGTIRLWHVNGSTLSVDRTIVAGGTGIYVQSLAFSPNGTSIAAGTSDGQLQTWTLQPSATPALTSDHHGPDSPVLGLAYSPNGRTLVTGTKSSQLQFWTVVGSGTTQPDGPALTAGNSWVNAVAFSPDGTELALATSAKSVQLWDPATHTLTATLPHPEPVASIAWSGNSTLISGCADGVLRLWSLPIPQLPGEGVINDVAFSPNDRLLAIASATLQLWNVAARTPASPDIGPATLTAEAVAFSPIAPLLAVGFSDGTVRLFNITDPATPVEVGQPLSATSFGVVETLAFSPNGKLLATGADDGTVRLWQVGEASLTPRQTLVHFNSGVFSVTFNTTGDMLSAGSTDQSVRLWQLNPTTGQATLLGAPLTGLPAYVYSVAFQPHGTTLAIGLADGTVELWSLRDPAHPTRDGPALTGPLGYSYSVTFSPDGSTLAAADTDDDLWLWNVTNPAAPTVYATLTGATDSLYTVAFDPTGDLLAAGGADGTVHLWQSHPALAAPSLCADLGQDLGTQAWSRDAPGLPVTAPCNG